MESNKIKTFLKEVEHVSKLQKKISEISGENFNIFNVLKVGSSETRLHSALISELINPKGTHGQGDKFLILFLKTLGITDFETNSAIVKTEEFIGQITPDYSEGGRLDISIKEKDRNRQIFIENKIYARDQESQLYRYKSSNPNAILLYLNLFGDQPSTESIKSTKVNLTENDYRAISYNSDILNWLLECQKHVVNLPLIRETISQYIHLIKYLTNQSPIHKMNENIKQILVQNPEFIEVMDMCSKTWTSFINETSLRFKNEFNKIQTEITLKNGLVIRTIYGEDDDGVWFGYKLFRENNNLTDPDLDKIEISKLAITQLKDVSKNKRWLFWFNPEPFENRKRLRENYEVLFKILENENYIDTLITRLSKQEEEMSERFRNILISNKMM